MIPKLSGKSSISPSPPPPPPFPSKDPLGKLLWPQNCCDYNVTIIEKRLGGETLTNYFSLITNQGKHSGALDFTLMQGILVSNALLSALKKTGRGGGREGGALEHWELCRESRYGWEEQFCKRSIWPIKSQINTCMYSICI